MRIRSTKPEFWRSETIASLDWDARLVLKGIEAYVDDNGVGKDSPVLICADVFPHDLARDPETLARVSRGLQKLAEANLIVRYGIAGTRYLYIRRWKTIQRVDKPNKGRYPRPDGTTDYSEDVDEKVGAGQGVSDPEAVSQDTTDSGDPREGVARPSEILAPGTGEQRNRGTEEQSSPPALSDLTHQRAGARESKAVRRMKELNATSRTDAADEVARRYDAWAGGGIDSETQIEVAHAVDQLLADEIDPHQIAEGIKAWHESDSWSPTQIRRFVAKAARPTTSSGVGRPTEKAMNHRDAAEQIIAEMESA